MLPARRSTEVFKGKTGKSYYPYNEMSTAAGVKKPNETPKVKALWKIKAAKDRREDFYDTETKRDSYCVKSTSKTLSWHWTKR